MNQVAIVTGASRGIGRGICLELAAIGFDLILNYRSDANAAAESRQACLERAKAAGYSIRVELVQADISAQADRARLIAAARAVSSRLDLLVNNAGIAPETRSDILEASEESFDRLMQVNVKGPYFLTQLAARWMIEQQSAAEAGTTASPKIVTISSISAYTASVNRGDYCISKAALSMITPLFASRLAEHGIKVYEIRPGIIATDMTAGAQAKYDELIDQGLSPIRRWGLPSDVGKAVAAIASDAFPFSTGEVFNVDGGFHLRTL
jgi:NAD(P)-dependent dehydrogenase (short-subunit alcohol dehydrogenase family)